MIKWYEKTGPEGDVVVSSRIRLARNLRSYPFPVKMNTSQRAKVEQEVKEAIIRNHAVYFAAIGGAGALLSKCIKKSEIICYEDLGAEAIRKIEVEDFPVIVVMDCHGNNVYETAILEYKKN